MLGCTDTGEPRAGNSWDTFRDQFLEEYFVSNPAFAVNQGRHEFDGRLPDWSAEGIKAEIDRLKSQRERALELDAAQLDSQQQFERDYLLSVIDSNLFWLETAEMPFNNPAFYLYSYIYGNSLDPSTYVSRQYAPLEVRLRAYTEYARAVPEAAVQIRNNLRTPLAPTLVDIGQLGFGGLASYLEDDVPAVFADVKDEELQSRFQQSNQSAIQALRDLEAWFTEQEADATGDYALGRERFSQMLSRTEMVDIPLEQLEEIGRQDLERNLEALKEACSRLAPGKSIQDCLEMVKGDKPEDGPVEAARGQLLDLKQFVLDKGLVSIPGAEEALVEESPPYMRWNLAYIDIPGPYEENLPAIYYISPPDPSWSPQEQRDYLPGRADLLFTSVHEVWPGHFLQFLHSNRSLSKFGQAFVGYSFAEGWAHYAEELMWEAGLGEDSQGEDSPTVHIGQLSNALLRNARFLSAIGLHSGTMTVEESELMFREKTFQDAGTARQQAARGTFDPAYLNYTMGKLMIRKLREDWTSTRGGREAWDDFHDRFLSFGGPPIPLVRRAMLPDDPGTLF
ncbi:MAG: DUF885 domain-containing protein [Acidobacteriota bacterium]